VAEESLGVTRFLCVAQKRHMVYSSRLHAVAYSLNRHRKSQQAVFSVAKYMVVTLLVPIKP
jgi:hypothetical protein